MSQGRIDYLYDTCDSRLDKIQKYDTISSMTEEIDLMYDGSLTDEIIFRGTLGGQTLDFGYRNGDLALTSFSYAGGTESYTYDDDGLLTTAGDWTIARNATTGVAQSIGDANLTITPDYFGPVNTLMDGAVYGVDYAVGAASVASWSVTRNNLGQIDYKAEAVGANTVEYDYTYDTAGRLDTVQKDNVLVEDYAYDAQGRRTGDLISGPNSYIYDTEDHLLSHGSTTYTYDADGFLTSKTEGTDTTTYVYGARGELASVLLPDSTLIEYVNGPNGQRVAKLVNGTVTEKYLWGGLTKLLAVLDSNNNVLQRFEYAGGRVPVAMTDSSGAYYLNYDQVGSLRAITNGSGAIVREVVYDSFGNIESSTGSGPAVPIAFAGGLFDVDTNLTRFGFRDYDSETGCWTAKDPIGFAGGDTDVYAYCGSNPISCTDSNGLANAFSVAFDWWAGNSSAADPVFDAANDAFWNEIDTGKGLMAGIDGFLPLVDPLERFYRDDCGDVPDDYRQGRAISSAAAAPLWTYLGLRGLVNYGFVTEETVAAAPFLDKVIAGHLGAFGFIGYGLNDIPVVLAATGAGLAARERVKDALDLVDAFDLLGDDLCN